MEYHQNPLRYFSFTCVPWQSSITEMPCSPLFRIGGADASFPYSEHISIVIMLPFQQNDDGNNNNNNNNTKKLNGDGFDQKFVEIYHHQDAVIHVHILMGQMDIVL